MIFGFRYRRIGAFVIDLSIVWMFAQLGIRLYYGVIAYLGKGAGVSLSYNDNSALAVLLGLLVVALLICIGVYVGYHWICYRLIGNSLSRYFLHIRVVSEDGQPLTKQQYLKREYEKIVFCIVSIGIYAFFYGAQFVTFGHTPYHDKRNHTKVIDD